MIKLNFALLFSVVIGFAQQASAYEWGGENDKLPPAPEGYKWQLNKTFTDEFNHWDGSKWQAKHDWWDGSGQDRPGAYVTGNNATDTPNVAIKDSRLMLYARANGPSAEKWIGTSVVASKTRLSYGYYEVKMQASKLSTTSAFWMQGKYSEIDVIEAIGAPKAASASAFSTALQSNTHYFPNGFGKEGYQQNPSLNGGVDGIATSWHTYGVWWKNNREAVIFLDGKQVTDFTYWDAKGKKWDKLNFPANFDEPMVMFFDTEVWNWGNGAPGLPTKEELNANDDSNAMKVEWVRGYRLIPIGKQVLNTAAERVR